MLVARPLLREPRSAAKPLSAGAIGAALALCSVLGCAQSTATASAAAHAAFLSRSFRIADGALEREPREVSADEALADLDDARCAFEQAYAGPTPPPPHIARAAAAIRARASWRPDDLAHLLRDLFAVPDGHLAFGYGGRAPLRLTAGARQGTSAPAAPSASAAQAGLEQALWSGARDTPSRPAAGDALRLAARYTESRGLASLPARSPAALDLAAPALAAAAPAPVELSRARGGVPVLAIRTFDSAAAPSLEALPAIARELRRAPGFVVDLRGNAGGNYLFAERFVLALTDAPLLRLDEREVVSIAAAEGRANSVRHRLARGDVPRAALPRFREQLRALDRLAADLRAQRAPRAEIETPGARVSGRASGPLQGRAVLLVDAGCASACEMMLALARQIPGVVVAGQNTRGGMAVGEIALFQLPRSGVTISLGTRAFRDPLGDFAETRGFAPDVRLDGGDALEDAVALARSQRTGGR